ncbi:uncharacterized protein LOC115743516 isoform X2 [Rhodamnia argentea]|uniref:Uncharacterized protein LOC115743516 isoform X2 n=1 Tax=Rhodamnia argentea TaxID=178133 RepID=A0A8B8PHB3_9MYRT|nr:uncharacterized protein LOC115743516 isoform X2 [Rhodamnia argentea]
MKDCPEPQVVSKSAKLPFEGYDVTHATPSGNMARLNFGGSALNVVNGENLSGYSYPLISHTVKSKPNRPVKSSFHHGASNADMDVYQSDLSQAVVNNTIPSKKDTLDFSWSGKGPYGTSFVHYDKPHTSNTLICQRLPLQADDRGGHVPSVSFSGCPRVYCLGTSGILLLSNTGVLGIVCSCHYSHMSVSKFCKHSGSSDANPGDVVLMDNGQTIAQWRQLYFEKFGIMFPEDQCWWDWPEGLSGTTGLVNSSLFMPQCSSPSVCQLAGSRGCLMGPRKHSVNVVSSNDQRAAKNFAIDGSQKKLQRSIQGRNTRLSEGLLYSLDQNQHAARENEKLESQRSRCFSASSSLAGKPDNGSQSSCCIGSIRKIAIAANGLPSFQKSRNLAEDSGIRFSGMRTANDCVLLDRDPAASKVELGLGQPHEQNRRTSGNSFQSFMGLGCLDSLYNKSETSHEQMLHSLATACDREESWKSLKNGTSSLSACARKERQVDRGNLSYSVNKAVHNHIEIGEGHKDKSSEISLFQQSTNIFGSGLYKDSNDNMKGCCEVVKPVLWHSISDTAKRDSVDVRPTFYYGSKVPFDNSGVAFHRVVDKGNVVKCLSDSSGLPKESRFTIHGKEENVAAFTGFTVGSSAKRNHFSDKLLDQPQDAAFNRESNSLGKKFPSHGSVHNGDNFLKPMMSPMCFRVISPLQASSSSCHLEPNMNPTLSKQEGINTTSCLLDDNMRLLALRQILELSQQHREILGLMSHGHEGYSGSSSFQMQQTLVDPIKVAGEEGTQSTCRQNDFEVDTTSLPVVATNRMFGVPPETGQDSMATASLFSLEANTRCQTPQGPLQHKQPSPRLNQSERIFPTPTIVERCCPILGSMCSPSISVGARQMKHPRGSFEFQADRTSKEWTERAGGQPHMFVAAENVKDKARLEEKHVALDQTVDLSRKIFGSSVNLSVQCSNGTSEVEGKGNTTCMDHAGHLVGGRGNEVQLDRADKCFDMAEQTVDSMKEHEKSIVSSGCHTPAVTQASIAASTASTCAVDAQHVECANQEREKSIVSSGCSVPAVTQASVTVNNDGTCAVDAQHVECANQLVVDEVSRVDQCCSPDHHSESKGSAEFHCTSPQANAKRVPSEVTSDHLSNNLLGELKFSGSLTGNKGRNRIHDDLPVHKRSKYLHKPKTLLKIRKRRRVMKLSELGSSFSPAEQTIKTIFAGCEDHDSCLFEDKQMFLHSGHQASCSDDDCFCRTNVRCYQSPLGPSKLSSQKRNLQRICNDEEVRNKQVALRDHINYGKDPLVRCVKKFRGISASDASGQPELNVTCHDNAEKFPEHKSIGFRRASPLQVNAGRKTAKPMVYGLYGEICSEDFDLYVSKPAKIVSLSRILKKARKCRALGIRGDMVACTSGLKKAAYGGSDASANEISNLVQNEDSKSHDIRSCKLLKRSAAKASVIACLEEEDELCAGKCGKNSVLSTHAQQESKFGRVRERTRSLNELSLPGVSDSSKKFSLKNSRTVTTRRLSKILNDTEIARVPARGISNVTNIKCYAEPDQASNLDADAFCCICRRLKQDKANWLLEGSQCLFRDLLQSEVEGVNGKNVHFHGRCAHHDKDVDCRSTTIGVSDFVCSGVILRCARTEVRKRYNVVSNRHGLYQGKCGSLVPQDQINAWTHIHGQKKCSQAILQLPHSVAESDCRKEYGRYKQAKGWKRLVVYKSGIHALGLYASQFIYTGEMVVEYIGEIVGLRIADKRESEYQSGRRIQCKSACYFFRIDKEHIIDATRKGGIARFVNHSCQPNCVAKVISVRDEKKVVFFADRDILPGQEITYDYHFNHEDEGKKIRCYCKSKNCRHYLN